MMPQQYYTDYVMSELHHQAERQAALEAAFEQQVESNRLMAALLEQAVRWNVEPARRATRIVPDSIERASTGLWKTVSSGQVAPAGNWNGLPGDEMVWTIDFIVQMQNGAPTSYPQAIVPAGLSLVGYPYDYAPYAIVTPGGGEVGGESFEVDIDTGARIVVPGRNIALSLGMDAALAGYAAGTMTLGAFVGLFAGTSLAPVKRTRRTGAIVAGSSSAAMIIPTRAKQLMPIRCSSASALGTCHIQDVSGTDLDVFDFAAGNIVASVPLP
ncbi:MAG: hypothetical protein AAB426_02960, partial [Myxococcota bacterium]